MSARQLRRLIKLIDTGATAANTVKRHEGGEWQYAIWKRS